MNRFVRTCIFLTLGALLPGFVHPGMAQKHYKELTFGKLNDVKIPQPKEVNFKNGIRVFILEDHDLPFIKMQANFVAGSAWEPAEKAGLAAMVGTVMRSGGSLTMHGDQIDEELEKIAATVETGIGLFAGTAYLSTLKEHIDRVLAIYADILQRPSFPPEKIELAKIEAKSAISRRNDDVGGIAQREFVQLIYGDKSVYGRDEEYASIDAITRDDLIAFQQKYVRPNGMVLTVWGDFKTEEMLKKLRRAFEAWKPVGDSRVVTPPVDYKWEKTINLVAKTDVNQSNIWVGHLGGLRNNPDQAALIMMNEILSNGSTSRLFKQLRTVEGLAYTVGGAYTAEYIYPGMFYMLLQTQSSRTVEAIRALIREMRKISSEKASAEELQLAKESWLNSYVFNFDSKDKTLRRAAVYAYYGYPLDYLQKLRQQIETVTIDDVLRVAQKYLRPDDVQILVVGNPAEFGEPLTALGPVNEIDITIPTTEVAVPEATAEAAEKGKASLLAMAAAMGGVEKVQAVQTMQASLKLIQVTPMGEMPMEAEVIIAYPDKTCSKLKLPQGEISMILNGSSARISSPQGAMPAPDAIKRNMMENLFRDPIAVIKNLDALTVQYVGEKLYLEKPALELIVSKEKMSFHLYLDKATQLPLGITYVTAGPQGPTESEERYEDYRDVGGIMMAFKTLGFEKSDKTSETSVLNAVINGPVDMKIWE